MGAHRLRQRLFRTPRTRPGRHIARPLPHPEQRTRRVRQRLRLRPTPVARLATATRYHRIPLARFLHPTRSERTPEPRTNFAAGWTLCTAETATSCGGLSAEWRTSPNLSPAHGTGDVKVTLSGVCPVRAGRCRVRQQPSAAAGSGRCGRERLKLLHASEAVGADFAARRPDRS